VVMRAIISRRVAGDGRVPSAVPVSTVHRADV
jgi:hypothetical protein